MLKFLLIFFIAIYLVGYIAKLLFVNWVKKVSNQQMNQDVYNTKKEGEVTIDKNPQNSRKTNSKDGEYIDYEEVKD
jgi:hypothetical protein